MFSDFHNSAWRLTEEWRYGPPRRLTSDDASIASLLWDRELGTSGALDTKIRNTAIAVKSELFDGRVYGVVPLYVTSICAEHCTYCNYRVENKHANIERLRLSDDELRRETEFLIVEKGLRAIELVYATDPRVRVDAICRQIEIVREMLERHGGGIVGLNSEAFDEADYRLMRSAGLHFAVVWQETYDTETYASVHPGVTKKNRFGYRVDAFERMIAAGLTSFGMGVLSGLSDWRRDWAMLMAHEDYLSRTYGIRPAILGIPRLKHAAGAPVHDTPFIPTTEQFISAVALHNVYSPSTLPFVSTREAWDTCLRLAAGGGSLFTFNCSTIPGGYSLGHMGYQFPTESFDAPHLAPALETSGLKPQFEWTLENARQSLPALVHD